MYNLENSSHGFVYSSPNNKDPAPIAHMVQPHQLTTAVPLHPHTNELGGVSNSGGGGSGMESKNRKNALVTPIDAKKTMAEISIPGMRAIFGRNAHVARRIIWIFILITCFSIAVLQVQDRVVYYLSTPVAVNVRVSRNDSLRFPILSLCNKNMYNMTAMSILKAEKAFTLEQDNNTQTLMNQWDVPDLLGVRGFDAIQVWDFISHSMEKMTLECWFGRNITCKSVGAWKKMYNYMGVCYSFYLNDPFVKTTGMFNNFYLKMNDTEMEAYAGDSSGWKILIHDRKDDPVIDIRTHGTTLYRGWAKDIRIYTREFQTLNTRNRPCIPDDSYSVSRCIARCFTDAAVKAVSCRLPFMDVPDKVMKPCTTSDGYRKSIDMVDKLLFYGLWSSNNCTCLRQCDQDIYIPYTETTQMDKIYSRLGKMRIYYQDFTFDDIEEELGYSAIPLLCDIGGSLGLLLGASVLTFFEVIEAMSAALVHFTHRIVNLSRT